MIPRTNSIYINECYYNYTDPFHHANTIRPIIPVPSFIIHVIVAANAVALLSPTPIPLKIACVVNVVLTVLQNACKQIYFMITRKMQKDIKFVKIKLTCTVSQI